MKPWRVVDTHTRSVMRDFASFREANRYAERLNQRYGAVRYTAEVTL